MITLVHPWLLALLALPFLLRFLLPVHREASRGIYAPDLERLARLAGARATTGAVVRRRSRAQSVLTWVTWVLLVTALAQPRLIEPPIVKTTPTRDVLLAVDLSGSMSIEDMTLAGGEPVDRLTAVKSVLGEFLARREGDRVGLVLFGSAAFVQAPFTTDLSVCRTLLDEAEVGMTGPRTVIGDAIGLSISVFDRSELEDKVLILLTDGNDTGSRVPPEDAAVIAKDRGIVIHVVAVGDPEGAGEQKLDEETLQRVASVTGGEYQHAVDREDLESIYDRLDEMSTHEASSISYSPTRELFQWPLGLAFLLGLLYHVARDISWTRANGVHVTGGRAALVSLAVTAVVSLLLVRAGSMHFLRPFWLLCIPLAFGLIARSQAQNDPLRSMRRFIDAHLLAALELEGGEGRRLKPSALLLVFWIIGALALSGPAWDREPPPFQEESAAFVVVLEVTPTMLAQDVQPSRLERATMKIQDLLAARAGSRAALVAYAGSAHLVAPLTRDHEVFTPFLVALEPDVMPEEGNRASLAIDVAARHMDASGYPGAILLVTDSVSVDEIEAMRVLRENGAPPVHVWAFAADVSATVPVGSPPAPALDRKSLESAASAGRGSLTVVRPDDRDVERVASRLESALRDAPPADSGTRWRDRGHALIFLLVALASFWFRAGWVVRRA